MTGKLSSEQSAHNIPLPPPDCNRSRPLIPAGEVSTAIRQLVLRLRRGNPVRKQRVTNSSRFDSDELDGPIFVEARSIDNSSPVEESMVSRQHFRISAISPNRRPPSPHQVPVTVKRANGIKATRRGAVMPDCRLRPAPGSDAPLPRAGKSGRETSYFPRSRFVFPPEGAILVI